jgi:hypothetical protein
MKKKSNRLGKRRNERGGSREREDDGDVGGSGSLVIRDDSIEIIHFLCANDSDNGDGEGNDDDDGEDDDHSDGEEVDDDKGKGDNDGDGEEDGDREEEGEGDNRKGGVEWEWKKELCPKEESDKEFT